MRKRATKKTKKNVSATIARLAVARHYESRRLPVQREHVMQAAENEQKKRVTKFAQLCIRKSLRLFVDSTKSDALR